MKYDYLIVGAGLYGAVFAREMTDRGKSCLVIDKRNHIAGNIYTEDVEGIHIHKYGAHIFHTTNVDSPLYPALAELVQKTAGPEVALREAFDDSDNDIVFIYGSRTKGCERADSDYDVFVVGREGLRKAAARAGEVANRIGIEVNPYVVTPEEFKRRVAAGDHFLGEVMSSPKIFVKGSEDELAGLA